MILSSLIVQEQLTLPYSAGAGAGLLQTDGSGNVTASSLVVSSGTWTPAFTNQSGISSLTTDLALYKRSSGIVSFTVNLSATTLGLAPSFDVSLPIARSGNFSASNQINAAGITYNAALTAVSITPIVTSVSGSQTFRVSFPSLSIGSWALRLSLEYSI